MNMNKNSTFNSGGRRRHQIEEQKPSKTDICERIQDIRKHNATHTGMRVSVYHMLIHIRYMVFI